MATNPQAGQAEASQPSFSMAGTKAEVMSAMVEEYSSNLDKDDIEGLSKVLFPDTHTGSVMLLGKNRTLRPLPIKHTKKVNALFAPFAKAVNAFLQSGNTDDLDMSETTVNALMETALVVAKFYEWEDVETAINGEEVSLSEVQMLLNEQQTLNGANDFLLSPLRVAIHAMQLAEIAEKSFHRSLSTQLLQRSGALA